jgi:hypothetical protein
VSSLALIDVAEHRIAVLAWIVKIQQDSLIWAILSLTTIILVLVSYTLAIA